MLTQAPCSLRCLQKLKLLFTVVVTLFGLLHIGAVTAWVMDSREKQHVADRLRDPACGYRITDSGVTLWRFGLDPLPDEIAAPSGPAVMLAAVFGLPMARLRAAMPDELFTTDFAASLGRKHGFSASGMQSTRDHHRDLLDTSRRISSSSSRRLSKSVRFSQSSFGSDLASADVDVDTAGAEVDVDLATHDTEGSPGSPRRSISKRFFSFSSDGSEPQSPRAATPRLSSGVTTAAAALRKSETEGWNLEHRTHLEEFVGTALVVAFLQVTQLMPVVEIARLRGAAAAHFEELEITSPAGWSFDDTATAFLTFLSPGVLNTRVDWWNRARLWKLSACPSAGYRGLLARADAHSSLAVLSQNGEGWWDPTTTVAFAMEARSTAEVAEVKVGVIERIKDKLMGMGELADDLKSVDAGQRRSSSSAGTPKAGKSLRRASLRRLSMMANTDENVDFLDETNDDPLWCNPRAISASMPRRLVALRSDDGEDAMQLDRVWTTLCACAFLQTQNVCWLATGEFPVFAIAARLRVLTRVQYPFCLSQTASSIQKSRRRWWTRRTAGSTRTRPSTRSWRLRWRTGCSSRLPSAPCRSGTAPGSVAW